MTTAPHDTQLLEGVLPTLVLAALAAGESSGYELVTRLQTAGLGSLTTGTVYPVLTRLERDGLLEARLDLPARRSRRVRRDVEAELVAADGGMRQAVAGLGSLRVLAAGYKEAEGRPLPRWWTGEMAAFVVAVAWMAGAAVYVAGLLDGSAGAGPGPTPVTGWYLWSDVVVMRSADSIALSFASAGPLVGLATVAVVFFVAGRGWRSLRRLATVRCSG